MTQSVRRVRSCVLWCTAAALRPVVNAMAGLAGLCAYGGGRLWASVGKYICSSFIFTPDSPQELKAVPNRAAKGGLGVCRVFGSGWEEGRV